MEERGACTPPGPNSLSPNEKQSWIWLPLAHSPDELTCGSPVAVRVFCDLREELTMFFTTLSAVKPMMKCHAIFQGPGWRALMTEVLLTRRLSPPIDSEYHVPSSSLPAWDPTTIMTTVETGRRGKCKLLKPLGGSSRKTETIGIPSLTDLSFLVLGCTGSFFKSFLRH